MSVPELADPNSLTNPYAETIDLLQQEIARLEEELRLRDYAEHVVVPLAQPEIDPRSYEEQLRSLTAELIERDEIIEILQEQTRLLEEARAADRAEWDELNRWVEQMEAGATTSDGNGTGINPHEELEQLRRELDSLRQTNDACQRQWESRRRELEMEIAVLHGRLAVPASNPPADELHSRLLALELENRNLAQRCRDLETRADVPVATEPLQSRIDELETELQTVRDALCQAREELAKQPRAKSCDSTVPTQATTGAVGNDLITPLTPNERLRALRLHLNEIQQREEAERRHRTLSARLARLWHRSI